MRWPLFSLFTLLSAAASAPCALRIEWQAATRQFATAGVYARVKALGSGELLLVYSRGADVRLRRSADRGATWGAESIVARTEGYSNTNAELIELANGWLVYGWNGRPANGGAYTIRTRVSRNRGDTWGDEALAYSAGSEFGSGCWEPAFLELPGGELQVYFANEGPYPGGSGDQEIGMLTSRDHGLTWGGYRVVSYRRGARDGMPAPLLLKSGAVALAIEDNGLEGQFKPVIVRPGEGRDWPAGGVAGASPLRESALAGANRLPAAVYAGAPYLARLPSGETLLSVQSTEGRAPSAAPTDRAVMQVYAGDAEARYYSGKSTPFPDIPADGNGLWNSLAVLDDSTVVAVSSVRGLGRDGIWTVAGRVRRDGTSSLPPRQGWRERRTGFGPPHWEGVAAGADGRRSSPGPARRPWWPVPFRP